MPSDQTDPKQADVGLALRLMRLFNEKADKLEGLSFTAYILSGPTGFHLEASNEGGAARRAE